MTCFTPPIVPHDRGRNGHPARRSRKVHATKAFGTRRPPDHLLAFVLEARINEERVMDDQVLGTLQVPFSPDDVAPLSQHDHIGAIFTDRDSAAAAVEDLRALGLGSEHLGVAVRGGESVVFEHDEDADSTPDTAVGAATGAGPGAVAGITLAALAIPRFGVLGVGGTLAIAGASTTWGELIGAYTGAAEGEAGCEPHEVLSYAALREGEVLVVVCSHGHSGAVRDALHRHAGRLHPVDARPA